MGVLWSETQELVPNLWNRNTQIKWNEEGAAELRTEIKEMLKPFKEKKQTLNILVFGPTACGKSSLCNAFRTTLNQKKNVSRYFGAESREEGSYTQKQFQFTTLEDCVNLYDMPGVFESRHIKTEDILSILQGRVKFTGKMDEFLHPSPPATTEAQINVSCVVLVLKPEIELGADLKRIIAQIHKTAGEGEELVPQYRHHIATTEPKRSLTMFPWVF